MCLVFDITIVLVTRKSFDLGDLLRILCWWGQYTALFVKVRSRNLIRSNHMEDFVLVVFLCIEFLFICLAFGVFAFFYSA